MFSLFLKPICKLANGVPPWLWTVPDVHDVDAENVPEQRRDNLFA